ncbi:glycosyltransferase family 4 protein [Lacticaseibacillus paracasei]|uniref:glycosyltransferase family 4 protein n=1 Tax=Lacticaseibacillus paracasei TaxID=1597 RepID=UPI000FF64871|nr:glycosyltransferase family 4 protein [Lacticaseibacillus paracasei]RND58141.1 Spore coat protein SA [Lacticaseibacillus paracasei]
MKVLFVVNIPSPYRVEFFSRLGEKCDLTVLFERHKASNRDNSWYPKEQSSTYKSIFLKSIKLGSDLSISLEIVKYLRQKYDFIVLGMYSSPTEQLAISYLHLHGIKFILSTDGGFISNESPIKRRLKQSLIGSASNWLSTGKFADTYLTYYGAKATRIYRYPFTSLHRSDVLPIQISKEEKQNLRISLDLPKEKILISVCRFVGWKGLGRLVQIMRSLENKSSLCLVLVGGTREELTDLIDGEIPHNIIVRGFMSKDHLFKYYQAADAFVLLTEYDPWGLVINEAMANGLPVISTPNCGAALELIESGKNGYIVNPDTQDNNSILDAINRVLNLEADLSINYSLLKIKNYTYDQMVSAHLNAFNQIKYADSINADVN